MGAYFDDGTIGHNYWLENRKLVGLLAVMVHRAKRAPTSSPSRLQLLPVAPVGPSAKSKRKA